MIIDFISIMNAKESLTQCWNRDKLLLSSSFRVYYNNKGSIIHAKKYAKNNNSKSTLNEKCLATIIIKPKN